MSIVGTQHVHHLKMYTKHNAKGKLCEPEQKYMLFDSAQRAMIIMP